MFSWWFVRIAKFFKQQTNMYAVIFLGKIKFTSYLHDEAIDYRNKITSFWFDGDICILDVSTLKHDKPKIITIEE